MSPIGRLSRNVGLGAIGVATIAGAAITTIWLRYHSPFRSIDSRAHSSYGACVFGEVAACEELIAVYREGCEDGRMDHCVDLADCFLHGTWVEEDHAAAATLFARACEAGSAYGCFALGRLHERGLSLARDLATAASLYDRACDLRGFAACAHAGRLYRQGVGVAPDLPRSVVLFRRACDMNVMTGCYDLGLAYAEGLGVAPDHDRALRLLERACDTPEVSCAGLAHLHLASDEPERVAQGRQLLERACYTARDGPACFLLALNLPANAGNAKAAELMEKSCALGVRRACEELVPTRLPDP